MPRNLAEVQAELTRVSNAAKAMLARALRAGTINQATHDELVREVSDSGDPEKVVVVTLRVRDAEKLAARNDLNSRVETALAGLARQAGVTVVAGSTTVEVVAPGAAPTTHEPEDEFPEDESDEYDPRDEEPAAAAPAGTPVTITARSTDTYALRNGDTSVISDRVTRALNGVGDRHGVRVQGVTVDAAHDGRVTIRGQATGSTYVLRSAGAREQVEQALRQLARDNGLPLPTEVALTVG